jgi:integrase
VRYCLDRGEPPHDASTRTLLAWLDHRVRNARSYSSAVKQSLAAARAVQRGLCFVHGLEAVPYTPSVRVQLDGFIRAVTMQREEPKRARALRLDDVDALVSKVRTTVQVRRGLSWCSALFNIDRDAALLLLGWWGALRADDIWRLRWEHVHFVPDGVELHLEASKTGQAIVALAERRDAEALCPVRALRHYLGALPGPVNVDARVFGFALAKHVGRRVQRIFDRVGLPRGYTAHSLRAGFATECSAQGIPDKLVQQHGRWRSAQQHAEYVRLGRLWLDTPTRLVTIGKNR